MSLQNLAIENAAPDQASLKAASKLLKLGLWPERAIAVEGGLIWGACQGSGASPYRVCVDLSDLGAKCTCPSRKFPCKHALALMLHYSRDEAGFVAGAVPDWVSDWLGRRRKTVTTPATTAGKSLSEALVPEAEAEDDPKAEVRKEAARIKREINTNAAVSDGLQEMEAWISDQLRTGLSEALGDLTARCRRIAARLVDAKAANLAARVDGIPAVVFAQPQRARGGVLISELGKLVLLSRAWRGGNCAAHIRREILSAETREVLMADPAAPRYSGAWEVLASREEARRDGLIARSTWLLGLEADSPRFALLQDFYPASMGKQGLAFSIGEQFLAELVFYPAPAILRAQMIDPQPILARLDWPKIGQGDPLLAYRETVIAMPWVTGWPVLLPPGRLALAKETAWWLNLDHALPLHSSRLDRVLFGVELQKTAVLWDAQSARVLAAETGLGRYHAAD